MSVSTMSHVPSLTITRTTAGFTPSSRDVSAVARVARQTAADVESWLPLVRFDGSRRWYKRLAFSLNHEVWLLTWLPGQATGLHDHGAAAGAFAVVHGALREITVRSEPDPGGTSTARLNRVVRTLGAGRVRAFGPDHIHDVATAGSDPAISIHVYSPALTTMTHYAVLLDGANQRLEALAHEQAGADW